MKCVDVEGGVGSLPVRLLAAARALMASSITNGRIKGQQSLD